MTDRDGSDFYEEDEPLDEVVAAFNRGEKGYTARSPMTIGGGKPIVQSATTIGVAITSGRVATQTEFAPVS